MKKGSSLTIAVLIVLFTNFVNAGMLGEENKTLGEMLAQSIEQTEHLRTMVNKIKATNETTKLATAFNVDDENYKSIYMINAAIESTKNQLKMLKVIKDVEKQKEHLMNAIAELKAAKTEEEKRKAKLKDVKKN